MLANIYNQLNSNLFQQWNKNKYISFKFIHDIALNASLGFPFNEAVLKVFKSFNCSDVSFENIIRSASTNDLQSKALLQYIYDNNLGNVPFELISKEKYTDAREKFITDPDKFIWLSNESHYPYYFPGKTYGYTMKWVRDSLLSSNTKFEQFSKSKTSDTAILIGNGPSLNKIDFSLTYYQNLCFPAII